MERKEDSVMFLIRELSKSIRAGKCEDDIKELEGITTVQKWVLGYLANNRDHDVYQRELETELNIGKSTLTEILHVMEKNKLVERVSSSTDGRCKKIVMLERAELIDGIISSRIRENEKRIRQGISEEELQVFRRTVRKMIDNISDTGKGANND